MIPSTIMKDTLRPVDHMNGRCPNIRLPHPGELCYMSIPVAAITQGGSNIARNFEHGPASTDNISMPPSYTPSGRETRNAMPHPCIVVTASSLVVPTFHWAAEVYVCRSYTVQNSPVDYVRSLPPTQANRHIPLPSLARPDTPTPFRAPLAVDCGNTSFIALRPTWVIMDRFVVSLRTSSFKPFDPPAIVPQAELQRLIQYDQDRDILLYQYPSPSPASALPVVASPLHLRGDTASRTSESSSQRYTTDYGDNLHSMKYLAALHNVPLSSVYFDHDDALSVESDSTRWEDWDIDQGSGVNMTYEELHAALHPDSDLALEMRCKECQNRLDRVNTWMDAWS